MNGSLAIICVIWLVPTIGLLVSSVRPPADVLNTGWWTVVPHQDYVTSKRGRHPRREHRRRADHDRGRHGDLRRVPGRRDGPHGERLKWVGNRRAGRIDVQQKQWVSPLNFTLANYRTCSPAGTRRYGTVATSGPRPGPTSAAPS